MTPQELADCIIPIIEGLWPKWELNEERSAQLLGLFEDYKSGDVQDAIRRWSLEHPDDFPKLGKIRDSMPEPKRKQVAWSAQDEREIEIRRDMMIRRAAKRGEHMTYDDQRCKDSFILENILHKYPTPDERKEAKRVLAEIRGPNR